MAGYTGISFPFRIGNKGRVVMSTTTDIEIPHIIESIRQILLTRKGERVNQPEFGANLYQLIFENIDETLISVLAYKVKEALDLWEPRIEVRDVFITEFDGGIEVTIDFVVIRTQLPVTSTISIERRTT
jgi:uncharacterized protein